MPNEKTQIAVAAILKHLDVPLTVASKDDRLMMQKAIYLAQASGARLGYSYNWYVNGPYSSSLADDYYEADRKKEEYTKYNVSPELAQTLQPVKQVLDLKPPKVKSVSWLEATGSLTYMNQVQKKPVEDLVGACEEHKPHLKAVLPEALRALQKSQLIR